MCVMCVCVSMSERDRMRPKVMNSLSCQSCVDIDDELTFIDQTLNFIDGNEDQLRF